MELNKPSTLYWSDYERLGKHVEELENRAPVKATWQRWFRASQDFVSDKLSRPPTHAKLSDLSAALNARLEAWAIIASCEHTPATRQLRIRLTVLTHLIEDAEYEYHDDPQLRAHIELQLQPVYGIISQYLQTPTLVSTEVRPLELRSPVLFAERHYMSMFLRYYAWNEEAQKHERIGKPYAMSVFLTYDDFDL